MFYIVFVDWQSVDILDINLMYIELERGTGWVPLFFANRGILLFCVGFEKSE